MHGRLVDLFLLVHAELARAHVYQEEEAAAGLLVCLCLEVVEGGVDLHDGEDLEKVVFGEVFVRVVRVQLVSQYHRSLGEIRGDIPSRNY